MEAIRFKIASHQGHDDDVRRFGDDANLGDVESRYGIEGKRLK